MANSDIPNDRREFHCDHCNRKILIPRDLPPTTGPCPHCGETITSPDPEPATAPDTLPAAEPNPLPAAEPEPLPAAATDASPETATDVAPPTETTPAPDAPSKTEIPPRRILPEPPEAPPAPRPTPPPAQPAGKIPAAPDKPTIPETPIPPSPPESAPAAKTDPVEIPHAADPSHANKRKPQSPPPDKAKQKQKSGLIPMMLVVLLLILAAGAAVYFVTKEMGRNIQPPTIPNQTSDIPAMEANYIRVGWQKDAYALLSDFMAATSSEEKLPYILNADALASRIEDFYGGGVINDSDTPAEAFSVYDLSEEDRKRGLFMMVYDQPPQFEMKEFFRPLASLEVQYGLDEADLLLSTLARVGNFAMEPLRVHAFFKREAEGLKLDWEIFAQTKYRTLQNFVELPEAGQKAVFRVFIVEDVPDRSRLEAGTRTYRIADPANTGDTARVNVKVDSETGRALSIINWYNTGESQATTRTATVELEWVDENSTTQLRISRFICWEFLGLGGEDPLPAASTQ